MENPPGGGMPGEVPRGDDDNYVTSTCRNARLEINTLASRRKNLRLNITVMREKLKQIEDDYWSQYHMRLGETDVGIPTLLWVSNFATKEGVVAKQTKQRLDEIRGQIQGLEFQLRKADDEFWGRWHDVITTLANIPQLNPSLPEAPRPSATLHAANNPCKLEDNLPVAPLPQPRPTSMLPTYATSCPLAPPAFFPNGPPLETPTTDEAGARHTYAPVGITESFPLSETKFDFTTAPSQYLPEVADSTASTEAPHNATANDPAFQGVTDPKVGHIYKAYYKHEDHEGWWMCTVLPTLPAHESEAWAREVGISFPSASLDLWHDAPGCYASTIQTKRKMGKPTKRHHVITGWQSGYEDGQPLVTRRAFPVLFFEDRKGVQGHFDVPMPPKKFNFKPHAWDWVEAKDLRSVDADVGPVYGEVSAEKFAKRLKALRQENESSQELTTTAADDQDGRPIKRPRIRIIHRNRPLAPAQVHSTEGQEETELTDAYSLSGDTIAASSSVVQSDDEMIKPLRVKSSVPAGLDTANIGRHQNDG